MGVGSPSPTIPANPPFPTMAVQPYSMSPPVLVSSNFAAIVREFRPHLAGGVAHCFTGDLAQARTYLDLDLYIGITGWICDERRGLHLREVVRHIPADRLLIETDAPYLLPRDLRPQPKSRRNEPAYLPHVLEAIAAARGESPAALAEATTRNALTLFNWSASRGEST